MRSLKVKLFSTISIFVVALALLIVGVWAVGETQTITMNGSVNFEIADKSLYVKDVRMQEDNNSAPYSLKDQGKLLPGFINGNFDMDLGDFTNSYGSFALYFDIINTMDETTSETFAYTVEQPTAPSGTTVSVSILDTDGTTLEQIPQGTVKPSEISDSTLVTATIKLTIASTSSSSVDLSGITITINQVVPEVYDYFTFEINEDGQTVTLTDYNKDLSDSTDVVIPSAVSQNASGQWTEGSTYTVTAIASATSGGSGVFYFSGITSVELPSTLQRIGDYAFYGCRRELTGELNLGGCTNLISIGDSAFYDCEQLTGELNLGECTNLISIGDRAFDGCSKLTGKLVLPSSLTSIGSQAFYDCSGIAGELDLSNCTSLTSIATSAFYNCNGITSVSLPFSITSIESNAFRLCSAMVEVYNYSNLNIIMGSNGYGYVGASAKVIYNASDLTGEKPSTRTQIIDDIYYYVYGEDFIALTPKLVNITSLTLDNHTTEVNARAFSDCDGLTNLDLSGCTSLTSIKSYAFEDCDELTNIILPSSLTSIGGMAFYDCGGIETVEYKGTLLEWLSVSIATGGNPWIISSHKLIINGEEITNLVIPEGIEEIERELFIYCNEITSITLPSSITSIGVSAFRSCSGLTELNLGECTNLTRIRDRAFYGCSKLTGKLVLPSSLTSIGSQAFYGCSGLISIELPNSLTDVGDSAFDNCTNLQPSATDQGVKYLGNDENPYLLLLDGTDITTTSYTVNSNCKIIYNDAFRLCSGLTSITLPSSITSIGDSAFYRCSGLTSITLPSSITSIGSFAFNACSKLTEVIIDSEYVYTKATSKTALGRILDYATTVKVLTSLVSDSHTYINATNFPNVTTEVIDGKNYTVYSK